MEIPFDNDQGFASSFLGFETRTLRKKRCKHSKQTECDWQHENGLVFRRCDKTHKTATKTEFKMCDWNVSNVRNDERNLDANFWFSRKHKTEEWNERLNKLIPQSLEMLTTYGTSSKQLGVGGGKRMGESSQKWEIGLHWRKTGRKPHNVRNLELDAWMEWEKMDCYSWITCAKAFEEKLN